MIRKILNSLVKNQGRTMLEEFRTKYTPFQMLIATLMSARARDSTTTFVARELFRKFKTPQDFVEISLKNLEKKIYKVGFYKTKSKHIKELSKILMKRFKGKVPDTLKELTSLPGVGRKTANCVLVYAFRKPAIPVDIHVHRISNRIGLIDSKTVGESELLLMKVIPKKYWMLINELFVVHGQTVCFPRNPDCVNCSINKFCNFGIKHIKKKNRPAVNSSL